MSDKKHLITTTSGEITYTIERSRRRTMAIIVRRDGSVAAKVPLRTSDEAVTAFMISKAGWIRKHAVRLEAIHLGEKKEYIDGEIHYYLGRPVQLRIIEGQQNRIEFTGDSVIIECKGQWNPALGEKLVDRLYRRLALDHFGRRLTFLLAKYHDYNFKPTSIKVRTTVSRWGSCSAKGSISLSTNLVKKREDLIDYVILHELCHLRHRNHGPNFYKLLAEVCPEYPALRNELKRGTY
jgi:predicted metal-dependent hydrolase